MLYDKMFKHNGRKIHILEPVSGFFQAAVCHTYWCAHGDSAEEALSKLIAYHYTEGLWAPAKTSAHYTAQDGMGVRSFALCRDNKVLCDGLDEVSAYTVATVLNAWPDNATSDVQKVDTKASPPLAESLTSSLSPFQQQVLLRIENIIEAEGKQTQRDILCLLDEQVSIVQKLDKS